MKTNCVVKLKEKNNRIYLAGVVIGIISIILGAIFILAFKNELFYSNGSSGIARLGTATFGADFYTEIYESTTFAANALKGVYEMISICFGTLFMLLGAADICFFVSKMQIAEIPPAKVAPEVTESNSDISAE